MADLHLSHSLAVLKFEQNDVWDVIMDELSQFCVAETVLAIDQQTVGENRIHQCGRASALSDFKEHLASLREQARQMISN